MLPKAQTASRKKRHTAETLSQSMSKKARQPITPTSNHANSPNRSFHSLPPTSRRVIKQPRSLSNTQKSKLQNKYLRALQEDKRRKTHEFENKHIYRGPPHSSHRSLQANITEKVYPNKSIYKGQISSPGGLREGKGIIRFANGDVYFGDWADDKFHGTGIYIFQNLERYEGELFKGAKHGKGTYFYRNGSVYVGDWADNFKNGMGKFEYFLDEIKYIGEWKRGRKHGKGRIIDKGEVEFTGVFVNGQKHGFGEIYFPKVDARFEGLWTQDLANGAGIMQLGGPSGAERYEGEYKNGLKAGSGRYSFSDGSVYEGTLSDDKVTGKGRLQYSNGDLYVGELKNGLRHGKGVYTTKKGDTYSGMYSDDLRHGEGVWRWSSGEIHEGMFKEGLPEGEGYHLFSNGDVYEGYWLDGFMHGKGRYKWADGGQSVMAVWRYGVIHKVCS